MKKASLLLALLIVVRSNQSEAQNSWTQKADFGGTARYRAAGFSINGKGYLGTGYDEGGYKKDFWEFDPALNTWTQKADFGGTARSSAAGFSINGKGYLGTGALAIGYKKDFWEYDPDLNTWTQKADFGGTARGSAVVFSIAGKGYLGMGFDETYTYKKDFWEYDPDLNTWTQKADFGGVAREHPVAFSIASKGYLGTGVTTYSYEKDFWEYDPDLNTWTQKADFGGGGRSGAIGFGIDSMGYLGMGIANDNHYKDFWEYDPSANIWTQKADFVGTARSGGVGFAVGSKGYFGTGASGNYPDLIFHKDFWEYTPDGPACPPPTDLSVTNITSTSAQLTWSVTETPDAFRIVCKSENAPKIIKTVDGATSSVIINDLMPGTMYMWGMSAKCESESSSLVHGKKFKTSFLKEEGVAGMLPAGTINIYPNPTNGQFVIAIYVPDEVNTLATIQVINTLGQVVFHDVSEVLNGLLQKEIQLNDAAAGMYLVKVIINDSRNNRDKQVYSSQISYQK
jgi:hypothetical protein